MVEHLEVRMVDKEGFLRRADRCRRFAAESRDRNFAIQWIVLARHYERLAGESELENSVECRLHYQHHLARGRLGGVWMRA